MENKYIIVRINSTSGPYDWFLNEARPRVDQTTRADVYGYARNKREAEKLAREANEEDRREANEDRS